MIKSWPAHRWCSSTRAGSTAGLRPSPGSTKDWPRCSRRTDLRMSERRWEKVPEDRLILALDVEPEEAKNSIRELAPHVGIFKIGGRLFTALGPQVVDWVRQAGRKVFLDLKFHDIPATVAGSVKYAARMKVWGLTVHASGGFAMMKEAQSAASEEARKLGAPKPLMFG